MSETEKGRGTAGAEQHVTSGAGEHGDESPKGRLAGQLVLFTLARIVIVLVLVGIIEGLGYLVLGDPVPILPAALIAIVLALPISMFALRGWRARINENIASIDENRRNRKEELRRRMSE